MKGVVAKLGAGIVGSAGEGEAWRIECCPMPVAPRPPG